MNLLIDLGDAWGNIVSLDVLQKISHIEVLGTDRLRVTCDVGTETPFQFQSVRGFTKTELVDQKRRLLGLSNGVIDKSDMQTIISNMESLTDKTIDVVLDNTQYDMMFVRKIWATLHGKPHFRFTLTYDEENKNVKVDESHNEHFMKILPDWLDFRTMQVVEDENDLLLMFAYEVLYQMAEPLLPEPEDGAMIDPDANIPTMKGTPMTTQQVDLSNTDSNVMTTL